MPQLTTFTLNALEFGLDVRVVQEVLREQPVTPVPLASEDLCGLLNLRGQILIVVDLRVALEWSPAVLPASGVAENLIIMQTGVEPVALLVDRLGDVVRPAPDSFSPCEDILTGPLSEVIGGAYRQSPKLLHLLNAEALSKRIFAGSH